MSEHDDAEPFDHEQAVQHVLDNIANDLTLVDVFDHIRGEGMAASEEQTAEVFKAVTAFLGGRS
jgi:hypothetical protein